MVNNLQPKKLKFLAIIGGPVRLDVQNISCLGFKHYLSWAKYL